MVLKATEDESEDILESYKRQMAEFMVQSHEKRLEAMDAVKAEVQRGYEEHIAELRAQVAVAGISVIDVHGDMESCCRKFLQRTVLSAILDVGGWKSLKSCCLLHLCLVVRRT